MNSIIHCLFLCCCLLGLTACSGDNGKDEKQTLYGPQVPAGLDAQTELRFKQYWTQGRMLYKKHCIGCHQNDGDGMAQLIPPLAGADYLKNKEAVICIIRHGQQGPVVVNGLEFNGNMPANPQLKALEVAEIATYIMTAWGNKGDFITVQEAEAVLKQCKPQL